MSDDAHLARIEERSEERFKHFDDRLTRHENLDDENFARLEQGIRDQLRTFERLIREAISAAVAANDAKTATQLAAAEAKLAAEAARNAPFRRGLGLLATAIVTTLVTLLLAALFSSISWPRLEPQHSTEEQHDRSYRK